MGGAGDNVDVDGDVDVDALPPNDEQEDLFDRVNRAVTDYVDGNGTRPAAQTDGGEIG